MNFLRFFFCFLGLWLGLAFRVMGQGFPSNFDQTLVLNGLDSPATMAFSPDGRLFIGERINGRLRIMESDGTLLAAPFLELDVPNDGAGNVDEHRSSGLRGFAFDPDFAANGFIYIFYMKQFPGGVRHNRVSRFQADPDNPNLVLNGSETVLMELPFNNGGLGGSSLGSSGSHNGGAVLFGGDGKLYFTTGDGWNSDNGYGAGDNVQSLTTYTGKAFRLNPDGSIPTDNPFYTETTGDFRAIYALGLRNPYAATTNPETGEVFIFDVGTAWGGNKDYVFRLGPGDNYKHDGSSSIGTIKSPWVQTGSRIVSGGTWYFGGAFPAEYTGNLFVTGWSGDDIRIVASDTDPSVSVFGSDEVPNNGPLYIQTGPDGNLYYLKSTYNTGNGEIYLISYTGTNTVSTPIISPAGGDYIQSVEVQITSFTPDAELRYTLDGSDPLASSPLYTVPLTISSSATLKARGFSPGMDDSPVAVANFTVDPGTPPDITSLPVTTGVKGALYEYKVDAIGLPAPIFSLDTAPAGMGIDPSSGQITWTPNAAGQVNVTVRASNGVNPDDTQNFTLDILDLRLAVNPQGIENGLQYSLYHGEFTQVPDFRFLEAASTGKVSHPDLSLLERPDGSFVRYIGFIEVPEDGEYTFTLSSSDGSLMLIGNTLVVNNDGVHGVTEASGSLGLQAGKHPISIEYFNTAGSETLLLEYAGPGFSRTTVPPAAFHRFQDPYGLDLRDPSPAYLNFPEVENGPMPSMLSETGAFHDVWGLLPNPGILPYNVNSPLWSDGAEKRRWISIPTGQSVQFSASGDWLFPAGTVFIKHFELGTERRRLETRFLVVKADASVYGVTYRWSEDGMDAALVGEAGWVEDVVVDGGKQSTWHYPSRTDCLECHNDSVGFVLGVRTGQLNGELLYTNTGFTDNQLRTWTQLGLFQNPPAEEELESLQRWVRVDDEAADPELRVKSYLAANCMFCHNDNNPFEGASFDARFATALEEMRILGVEAGNPLGENGMDIIKPQDPHLSAMYRRMNSIEDGVQMPPLARKVIDPAARSTLIEWILSLDASTSADVADASHRWRFDDDLSDAGGSADGSWRGGGAAGYGAGQLVQALGFDGVDDAVDLPNLDLPGSEMTITFWFRADDFGIHDARFISKANDQSEQAHWWMLSTLNDTQLRFRLKAGGSTTTISSAAGTLQAGVWTHIAAVYDGSTMRLYKDGAEVAQTAKTGAIDTNPAIPVSIGNQPASAAGGMRPFDGWMDDVRIYTRALDAAEIVTIRDAASVVNEAPMVTLLLPNDGGSAVHPATLSLEGSASDPEDGEVSATLRWLSSLDGPIGTGPSLTTASLSPGEHEIIVTATDSDGAAASQVVSFRILTVLQEWAESFGLSGDDTLPFANPDGGSLKNLAEHFLGGNPTLNDDDQIQPVLVGPKGNPEVVGIRFRKSTDAYAHTLWWSLDLGSWQDASLVPGFEELPAGADNDGTDLYEAILPAGMEKQLFFRLEIRETP